MNTPFYTVLTKAGKDITELVSNFRFEDSLEEDNMLVLAIDKGSQDLVDDSELQEGKMLIFQYGYVGGKTSEKREAIIKNVPVVYEKTIKMTIQAFDKGIALKREADNKIYKGKTVSQIVEEIAKLFKFAEYEIEATSTVHDFIPQSNKTFYEFLKYLADLEGSGKDGGVIQFVIRDNKLIFSSRKLEKKPVKLFTYNDGNGEVIRFKPEVSGDNIQEVKTSYGIDPETNKEYIVQTDANRTQEESLGDKIFTYSIDGLENIIPKPKGKIIVNPKEKQKQKEREINTIQKNTELAKQEGVLTIVGNPNILSNDIITLNNLGDKYNGNWNVTKAEHSVKNGGYVTVLKLSKNATKLKSASKINTKKPNKQIGDKEVSQTKKVKEYKYNINGKQINKVKGAGGEW